MKCPIHRQISRLVVARAGGERTKGPWGGTANQCAASLEDDKNILKLVVMVV